MFSKDFVVAELMSRMDAASWELSFTFHHMMMTTSMVKIMRHSGDLNIFFILGFQPLCVDE